MSQTRLERGRRGEEAVVALCFVAEGYAIIERNARVGRLEIDIVAKKRGTYVFCEVRTRTRSDFGDPIESIDAAKLDRMRRAALGWMESRHARGTIRIDAAGVLLSPTGLPEIDWRQDIG